MDLTLDPRTGFGLIILTVCFFNLFRRVCEFLPLPKSVRQKNDDFRTFRWRNLIISWFHACVVGTWAFLCVLIYFNEMWNDMVLFINTPTFTLCCFTTGYFVYDTLDIIVAGRIVEKWEILLHHSAIIFSAGYIIVSTNCVGYQVFAMLIEVNTSFLHTRKLMQMAAVPRLQPIVQLNVYVNLLTFVIFRFIPLGVLFYGMIYDGHRVPSWFLIQYSVCVAVLFIVNFILFYRLLKADVFRSIDFNFFGKKGSTDDTKEMFSDRNVTKRIMHRKIDSGGGFCASLNIIPDEYPPNCSINNAHSRNTSVINCETLKGKNAPFENNFASVNNLLLASRNSRKFCEENEMSL